MGVRSWASWPAALPSPGPSRLREESLAGIAVSACLWPLPSRRREGLGEAPATSDTLPNLAPYNPFTNSAPCFTCAVEAFSVSPIGSARPPRQGARKFSATALNAMPFTGRAKPCPSSGNST